MKDRVSIRSLVSLHFEADKDGNPCGALHRLPACGNDSHDFACLVGGQVYALWDLLVILDKLFADDRFLLIFRLTGLQETTDGRNLFEESSLRLEKRSLALRHLASRQKLIVELLCYLG